MTTRLLKAESERDQARAEVKKLIAVIQRDADAGIRDMAENATLKAAARALLCTMPVSFRGLVREKSKALEELL